jgi:hypothetical protein
MFPQAVGFGNRIPQHVIAIVSVIYIYIVLAEWINIQYIAIVIGVTRNANLIVTLLV